MANERILIVDDEEDILELISFNLKKEHYAVVAAKSGEEALKRARDSKPDLIVLDLMLPGLDGLEVCRRLKQNDELNEIPILMLTAKSEDSDIITGLELGADDYLTKPFSPKILVARVRAVMRRTRRRDSGKVPSQLAIHGIAVDTVRHEVTVDGRPVDLSVSEFAILSHLAANPGWVFSRSQIITAVKGDDYPVTERSVDVQILGIRKKLGSRGAEIETVRGVGYRMREE